MSLCFSVLAHTHTLTFKTVSVLEREGHLDCRRNTAVLSCPLSYTASTLLAGQHERVWRAWPNEPGEVTLLENRIDQFMAAFTQRMPLGVALKSALFCLLNLPAHDFAQTHKLLLAFKKVALIAWL